LIFLTSWERGRAYGRGWVVSGVEREGRRRGEGERGKGKKAYDDLVGCVAECVEIDEFFDFPGKAEKGRDHDAFEEAG
jgi:hypothetical protein